MLFKHYIIKPGEFESSHRKINIIICISKMSTILVESNYNVLGAKVRESLGALC